MREIRHFRQQTIMPGCEGQAGRPLLFVMPGSIGHPSIVEAGAKKMGRRAIKREDALLPGNDGAIPLSTSSKASRHGSADSNWTSCVSKGDPT
jgi:hypothetical protein